MYEKNGQAHFETRALRALLALAGVLIVAGALLANPATVLLSIAACLVCATRMERNYHRGAYGAPKPELLD